MIIQSYRKKKNQFKKYKHIILFLGSFLTLRRAENLKMSLLKLNLREVQILERTSFGFHRVRIKCYASYRLGGKDLPFYIDLGYLDAWIIPYLVEVKEE